MNPNFDFEDVIAPPPDSSRTKTVDGYLVVPAVLARAGVFKYRAHELNLKDGKYQPDDLVTVYRSRETLEKSVEGFESQAITLDHKWTNSANWRTNAIGDVRDVTMNGDDMDGTLIVRDGAGIKAIEGGKTQLSNGYRATIVHRPGKHLDQLYEYEQINFVPNHVAIVDKARCGSTCRLADSAPPEEPIMITRNFDGLTISLENEQSGQVFDRVVRTLEDNRKELDALKKIAPRVRIGDKDLDAGEVQTMLDCQCQELKTLKEKAQTPEQIHALVVARSNAITHAKDMVPDFKVGDADTAHDIRVRALDAVIVKDEMAKEMLTAAIGAAKVGDAKPEAVEVAFATISAGLRKAKDVRRVRDSREQVGRIADASASPHQDKDPREAYMERQRDAWKQPSKTEVN